MDYISLLTGAGLVLSPIFLNKLWDLWREKAKYRYEDKRLLKQALFHLLNVYYLLKNMDFETLVERLLSGVQRVFTDNGIDEEAVKKMCDDPNVRPTLVAMLIPGAITNLKEVETQLKVCVKELASIQPLMAFNLAQIGFTDRFESVKGLFDGAVPKDPNAFDKQMFKSMDNKMFSIGVDKAADRVREYCLAIAAQIDRKTRRQTLDLINAIDGEANGMAGGPDSPLIDSAAKANIDILFESFREAQLITPFEPNVSP